MKKVITFIILLSVGSLLSAASAQGKPLSDCQQRRNTRIAKTRVRVEHIFAGIEQLGGKSLRCIGLERATLQLNWKVATYNLRRLCSLKTNEIVAF